MFRRPRALFLWRIFIELKLSSKAWVFFYFKIVEDFNVIPGERFRQFLHLCNPAVEQLHTQASIRVHNTPVAEAFLMELLLAFAY